MRGGRAVSERCRGIVDVVLTWPWGWLRHFTPWWLLMWLEARYPEALVLGGDCDMAPRLPQSRLGDRLWGAGLVRSLRDQCTAAGVPFFFKQWGGPTPKSGGRVLDRRTWDEYPEANED